MSFAETNPANAARGETAIIVAGETHVLRPSFNALVLAEQELGSLFAMVERASEGALTVAEITGLLWHCMAPEARPERDALGEAVLSMGLVEAAKPVREIFAQVLKGSS
ncbi:gene transfer agent family protein [Erythrobacter sp. HA6-11]